MRKRFSLSLSLYPVATAAIAAVAAAAAAAGLSPSLVLGVIRSVWEMNDEIARGNLRPYYLCQANPAVCTPQLLLLLQLVQQQDPSLFLSFFLAFL